ncbi:phosphoribosyltransferase family protein [Oerskovia sp. M15]
MAGRGAALAGTACLLVDDVLTTGATLAACERALEGLGTRVLGAFVLAATPLRGRVPWPGKFIFCRCCLYLRGG